MNVLTLSLIVFCASSSSSQRCEGDVALLQLNSRAGSSDTSHFSSSQVSLSPLERIGPNVHRHKLAFSEANVTLSTTEPTYREIAGYWAVGSEAAASLSDSHNRPLTPSEAKAILKRDPQIMGYSYEKSHPDVAYVKSSGSTFVPSKDWVSVIAVSARPDDHSANPAISAPAGATTEGMPKEVFNWENPPPDYAPLKAEKDEIREETHKTAEEPAAEEAHETAEEPAAEEAHETAEEPSAEGAHETPEEPAADETAAPTAAAAEPTAAAAGPTAAAAEPTAAAEEPTAAAAAEPTAAAEIPELPSSNATASPANATEHPGSLATGVALALLAAFCD